MISSANFISIIGRCGADPTTKVVGEKSLATLNVGVSEKYKNEEKTYWFSVEFWGKQAETAASILKKGKLISVIGSVKIDEWEKDGVKNKKFVINGENFKILSTKAEDEGRGGSSSAPASSGSKKGNYTSDDFMEIEDDIPPF